MRQFRDPVLIGLIVFLGYLIASFLNESWEEALTAGLGAVLIVWIVKGSD